MHQKGTVVKAQRRQTDLEVLINPPASLLGVKNAVLTGRARQYHTPEFPGPLSIKTVARGSARWQTTEADRLVDTGNYLILNAGHPTHSPSTHARQQRPFASSSAEAWSKT
jgi:hypothetical protein